MTIGQLALHIAQPPYGITELVNGLVREIPGVPRVAVLPSILFNRWYHHRGQLTVYLRLLDVALPAVYGATRTRVRVRRACRGAVIGGRWLVAGRSGTTRSLLE